MFWSNCALESCPACGEARDHDIDRLLATPATSRPATPPEAPRGSKIHVNLPTYPAPTQQMRRTTIGASLAGSAEPLRVRADMMIKGGRGVNYRQDADDKLYNRQSQTRPRSDTLGSQANVRLGGRREREDEFKRKQRQRLLRERQGRLEKIGYPQRCS